MQLVAASVTSATEAHGKGGLAGRSASTYVPRGRGKGRGGHRQGAGRPANSCSGSGKGRGRPPKGKGGRPSTAAVAIVAGAAPTDPEQDDAPQGTYVYSASHGRGYELKSVKAVMLTFQTWIELAECQIQWWWAGATRWSHAWETGQKNGLKHTHVYIEWEGRMSGFQADMAVAGNVPDLQPQRGGGRGRAAYDRGHCYLQVAGKLGSEAVQTNWVITKDFHPRSAWIMQWNSQGKIGDAHAVLTQYKLLTPHLATLIFFRKSEESKQQRTDFKRRRVEALKVSFRPFRIVDEVVLWQAAMKEVTARYQFLWLHGPSGKGKTKFALSLYENPFVMSGAIAWHGFSPMTHNAVIFDDVPEIEQYVLRNKTVFQSSGDAKVHGSATMCHAVSIDTEQVPLIICDNEPPTQSWVISNCIKIACYSNMWQEAPSSEGLETALAEILDGDAAVEPPSITVAEEPAPATPPEAAEWATAYEAALRD